MRKKIYNRRVLAKLTGDKQTTIWINGKYLPIIKEAGVTNQIFAQTVFDAAMEFIVNINLETKTAKIIDHSGVDLSDNDKKYLAQALAKEIVKNLPKEEGE